MLKKLFDKGFKLITKYQFNWLTFSFDHFDFQQILVLFCFYSFSLKCHITFLRSVKNVAIRLIFLHPTIELNMCIAHPLAHLVKKTKSTR